MGGKSIKEQKWEQRVTERGPSRTHEQHGQLHSSIFEIIEHGDTDTLPTEHAKQETPTLNLMETMLLTPAFILMFINIQSVQMKIN